MMRRWTVLVSEDGYSDYGESSFVLIAGVDCPLLAFPAQSELSINLRRDLQEPNSIEVLSAFRGRGADRRWGFGASCGLMVREETGRLSPP